MHSLDEETLLKLLIEFHDTYRVMYDNLETFTFREIVGQLYINEEYRKKDIVF